METSDLVIHLPALRAEFGHPDVAIMLTCLSYYYQGLSEVQIKICFHHLLKLDNPTMEYEIWVYANPKSCVNFVRLMCEI